MVKFVQVDPKNIAFNREGRRGRVSYPILKSFLETNMQCVQIDRTGMQQSFQALYSMLRAYITSHKLPVKIFSSSGELYLMRLDMDENGNIDPDWQFEEHKLSTDGNAGLERHIEAVPISESEVATRAAIEKNKRNK